MSDKKDNFKEQFKQALISTAKVISNDYKPDKKNIDKSIDSKNIDFFEINSLSNINDFIRLRAQTDSAALKKKFSNKETFSKYSPNKQSCKSLYNTAEKIRYELLGSKMLNGIRKNLTEHYYQKINIKYKDELKTKKDVSPAEAFELYMLKNFFDIKLNSTATKMLNFWEKDFNASVGKHIDFLNKNLDHQDNYGSKFSEILDEMNIFNSENNEEKDKDENKEDVQDNRSDNNDENQSETKEDKNKQEETTASLDSDFNLDENQVDQQLADADSSKDNLENILQKKNLIILNKITKFLQINLTK